MGRILNKEGGLAFPSFAQRAKSWTDLGVTSRRSGGSIVGSLWRRHRLERGASLVGAHDRNQVPLTKAKVRPRVGFQIVATNHPGNRCAGRSANLGLADRTLDQRAAVAENRPLEIETQLCGSQAC
jgi:hypothetical protein